MDARSPTFTNRIAPETENVSSVFSNLIRTYFREYFSKIPKSLLMNTLQKDTIFSIPTSLLAENYDTPGKILFTPASSRLPLCFLRKAFKSGLIWEISNKLDSTFSFSIF